MAAPEIVPLCDAHLVRMGPTELWFLLSRGFVCPDPKCTRYYGPRLGYFSLLPRYQGEREKIDPIERTPSSRRRHRVSKMPKKGP
jgi:hypothetical protein